MCMILLKYKNQQIEIFKKVYESKFNDYRDIDEEEMNNYINKNIGEFLIHKPIQELSLNDLLWDYDAVSVYPSAVRYPESNYPRKKTGYLYTKDMNDELVGSFNNQTFTKGSAFLKNK